MKKSVLFVIYLLGCCLSFAQGGSDFLNDIEVKPKIKIEKCLTENIYSSECLASCSGIDRTSAECVEYLKKFSVWERKTNKAYYDNWDKWMAEDANRKRIITFLIWFGSGLAFMCICFVVFRLVKNRIALRIKQRAEKHTLDDVFAAGKGK